MACDSYHRHTEDIELLKKTGAQAYRFSISWSRVIPLGGRNDPVNQKGLDYYVKLVEDLFAAGITPLVTLFHWDLPDELYKRYDGFLNKEEFVADFERYARVIFEALPRVKHWITFNEPYCSAILGHNFGIFAPGHTSDRKMFHRGDSSREPWTVGHNVLVAHAKTVKMFRDEFKPTNGGEIGITLNGTFALTLGVCIDKPQVTGPPLGTPRTRRTSKPPNDAWNSGWAGTQIQYISANIRSRCATS